jgi:hypothetical protein
MWRCMISPNRLRLIFNLSVHEYASDFVLSISVIRFGLWVGLVSIKLARLEASATLR